MILKVKSSRFRLCIQQSVLTVRDFMTWHAGALKLKGRQEKLKSSHFRFAKNFQMKKKMFIQLMLCVRKVHI